MNYGPGQYVIANDLASRYYSITKKGWVGLCIHVDYRRRTAHVQSLDGRDTYSDVRAECFDRFVGALPPSGNPYVPSGYSTAFPPRKTALTGTTYTTSTDALTSKNLQDMVQKMQALNASMAAKAQSANGSITTTNKTRPSKPMSASATSAIQKGDFVKIIRGNAPSGKSTSDTFEVGCIFDNGTNKYAFFKGTAAFGGTNCSGYSRCTDETHHFAMEIEKLKVVKKGKLKSKNGPKIDMKELERLVLPEVDVKAIKSVLGQHESDKLIFEKWGLSDTVEYGKGMGFLFHGLPGTGKTWAAKCIAKALGKEMHSIGPADIQTQEPGGAERAIKEAFKVAREKKMVLLIDECDSLVSDRKFLGAILAGEVNTLLTEIEKSEGVTVLATNRVEHLDPALERRLALILEFKVPTFEQRELIWTKMLPKKMPLAKDVKVAKLSEYSLTGGQIKNALLGAARLAAAEKARSVSNDHFEAAIARIMKSKDIMGKAEMPKARMSVDRTVDVDKVKVEDSDRNRA